MSLGLISDYPDHFASWAQFPDGLTAETGVMDQAAASVCCW